MSKIGIRPETNTLYFDFRVLGIRCREQTPLRDTKENRKKMQFVLDRLDEAINDKSFNYRDFFPESGRISAFEAAQQKAGEPRSASPIGNTGLQPSLKPVFVSSFDTSQINSASPHRQTPLFSDFTNQWYSEMEVGWKLWTSAGVTTGIDMNLEMVAQDLGTEIANIIAKRLVLYAKRPGYQSQFSPLLKAQENAEPQFLKLVEWLGKHLDQNIDIPRMAEKMAMSERTFYRKFTQCFGETPRDYVEKLRLDNVRILLTSKASLKQIALVNGYSTASQLTKAFERQYGIGPAVFRKMHST
jgi:AraC-like DNA-binding protein